MTTTITQVDNRSIEHGVLIDLTLDGTTYYISNCYKSIDYDSGSGSHTYEALAGFLTVSEIQSNISNANDEIQVSLSAIPPTYIAATLNEPIKGGEINIYRAFFDYTTQEIITGAIYRRFTGIISNYSVQEDLDATTMTPEVNHTITIIASSVMGVLENKISGRRTNKQDYALSWTELPITNKLITAISSNVLTSGSHGLAVGQQIKYLDTTQLGLTQNQVYYVIAPVAANTFKLSATLGGASLTLTNGSGLSLDWYYVDLSMDRVDALFNSSFDFGKDYVPRAASTVGGTNGGGGSNGNFNDDNVSAGGSE
jgi:hypothetical protein